MFCIIAAIVGQTTALAAGAGIEQSTTCKVAALPEPLPTEHAKTKLAPVDDDERKPNRDINHLAIGFDPIGGTFEPSIKISDSIGIGMNGDITFKL